MSKTNTENTIPEMQAPETAGGLPLDVRVRPIAPMGNLLAFANVTIGGCFKIDGFRICSGEKGLYVNMPSTQDKNGNWKDVCWPVTAEFRKQLNDALLDGYGQAIENLQATLEATKGAAEKPSLSGALKENAGKVKSQPVKDAPAKNGQERLMPGNKEIQRDLCGPALSGGGEDVRALLCPPGSRPAPRLPVRPGGAGQPHRPVL